MGWCNPLILKFTAKGRKLEALKSSHPLAWGLRLYQDNYDNGLTFKVQLLKTIPNNHKTSIGPNPQLHHPKPPNNPDFLVPAPLFLPHGVLRPYFSPISLQGAPLFH